MMNDSELNTTLDTLVSGAKTVRSTCISSDEEVLARYNQEYYGNERDGRSKYVASDVFDLVETDMPAIVKMFLNTKPPMQFLPMDSEDEKQKEEAEHKTKYAQWIINNSKGSYETQHNFLKKVLMKKYAVVKYFYEDAEKTEERQFENLSEEELDDTYEVLKNDTDVKEVDFVDTEQNEDGSYNVTFKVTIERGEIQIVNIPNGSFLISNDDETLECNSLVGNETFKTRGELLAEGYSRALIDSLPRYDQQHDTYDYTPLNQSNNDSYREWASQEILIQDLYVLVDYDGDGIAERRNIERAGQVILSNEAYDHVPYAGVSAVLMPDELIGKSRAEQVLDMAKINTQLTRDTLDNSSSSNNPKLGINDNVNIADLAADTIGGFVRNKGESVPAQNTQAIVVPYTADKTQLIMQMMDVKKAAKVGTQLESQGLTADQVNDETATRFNGMKEASAQKIGLVARNINEVFYKKLYEGIIWMATRHQNSELEISVLGKPLKTSPSKWKYKSLLVGEAGVGSGDEEKQAQNITAIIAYQKQLKAEHSPLYDSKKEYNAYVKLIDAVGMKSADNYFNNPEEPNELLMYENEQLNMMVLQLQQQMQAMQNPLAESEQIKAQAKLIEAQGKGQLEQMKMQESSRQFDIEMQMKMQKQMEDMAAKLTELELKYSKDVKGSIV